MRFFVLVGFQDVVLYLIPTIIFIVIFGIGLGYAHFHSKDSEARKKDFYTRYPEDISDRKAPFPLFMTLVIMGTVLWMLGYVLAIGFFGVRI